MHPMIGDTMRIGEHKSCAQVIGTHGVSTFSGSCYKQLPD